MKGYKAFDKDLRCYGGYQFEIGKTYEHDGEIEPCRSGFHFCKTVTDCYNFYDMSENTRICEIEAIGEVKTDDDIKFCTDKITILKEIKNPRKKSNLSKTNSGYCNSGNSNSGDRNSGDSNSGDRNSGDWNSGDCNSGDRNSGDCNSGDRNSGDRNSGDCNSGNNNSGNCNSGYCNSGDRNSGDSNSGDRNSGNRNSGNRNSGYWNSGYWNSGVFNTDKNPKIKMFDKESDWTMDDWWLSDARIIMKGCPYSYSAFVYADDMTDEEKEKHPEYKTIGGYVKVITVTDEDKQKWWDGLSETSKKAVMELPNFDADKFKECTGIKI